MSNLGNLHNSVPGWVNQPFGERLNLALSALKIHGIISQSEFEKAKIRLQKKWDKQKLEKDPQS